MSREASLPRANQFPGSCDLTAGHEMKLMAETRLLFVCLGNVCRSPLAEAICRRLIDRRDRLDHYIVASAGLGRWHSGAPADRRAVTAGRKHGIDLSGHRARAVAMDDFREFDLLLAMDRPGLAHLRAIAPPGHQRKLQLLLDYSPWLGIDSVLDPSRNSATGFDDAIAQIEAGISGLISQLDQSWAALQSS